MISSRSPRPGPATHRAHRDTRAAQLDARNRGAMSGLATPASMALAALVLAALVMTLAVVTAAAQEPERYGERLSRMPVDLRTTSAISGGGDVTAELVGNDLTIIVRFSGLSSGVTAAHVHNAPVARRGGVAFAVDLGGATGIAGEIADTVTLTDDQIAELRGERYYVQIHSENNPGGELRGWLLRRSD